jgi:hypothetical protein
MLFADRYRRQAHNAAWYDSPDDEPNNLPVHLRNPFGKRNPRSNTRNHNELHQQEAGVTNGGAPMSSTRDHRSLRQIKSDGQDYRPTTSQDRARELGLDEHAPHSATTPNVDSAPDFRNEKLDIPRADSPVNAINTADKVERVKQQRGHGSTSSETAVENQDANKSPLDQNYEGTHHRNNGALRKVTGLFRKKPEETGDDDDDGDNDPDGKSKQKRTFTLMSQVRGTILNSWINVLLIACALYPSSDTSMLMIFSSCRDRTLLRACKAGGGFRRQFHCYHPSSSNA